MEIQQIFLSYSRPDQDQAEQIAVRLDREGYRVWYDQAKIVPGESWSDALERGRLVFIVTMRDDFYGLCGSDDMLRALISENHHLLAPMSTAELNDAVERPARNSGKAVQPALLTLIE
jgi:hypothetical protein